MAGEDADKPRSADAELRGQHERDEPTSDTGTPDQSPGEGTEGPEDSYGVLMLCARHARELGAHAHVEVETEWCDRCNAGAEPGEQQPGEQTPGEEDLRG